MKVGFTGTRQQLLPEQHHALCEWIKSNHAEIVELHQGCCIGADAECCEAFGVHARQARIVGHPPSDQRLMSHCAVDDCDELREPKDFIKRNHAIVNETDMLLACPKGPEELRSGTWATIRYAMKQRKEVWIIWPTGATETRYHPHQSN